MIKLSELREQTGHPITRLLHEAVGAYYETLQKRLSGVEPSGSGGGETNSPTAV